MKRTLAILTIIISLFISCKKDEKTDFWEVLNCFMIVNNTNEMVVLRLNYPILTQRELQPKDTFKYLVLSTEKKSSNYYEYPFNAADSCILTIKDKDYYFNRQDTGKGNPLLFDNYLIEKKSDLYYNLIFEINNLNYNFN